jgi:hypothetical protein
MLYLLIPYSNKNMAGTGTLAMREPRDCEFQVMKGITSIICIRRGMKLLLR